MLIIYHCYMLLLHLYIILWHFPGLTYWQDAKCQFLFFVVFGFQKSYTGKVRGKIREKSRSPNTSRRRMSQKIAWRRANRGHTGPRRGPTWTRAWHPRGAHLAPLASPLRLFQTPWPKTLGDGEIFHETEPEPPSSRNPFRGVLQPCSGTLPEGGIITGGIYTTMIASPTMRE